VEEVNIGYGTVPRERVTGAVGSLGARDFTRAPVGRVEELLIGRFPGVRVGSEYRVRVRGTSTLSGTGEPLYVIDGIPVSALPGRALDGIHPGDVERIEVLKDAAATAIYGSRGASGVIVVTMKRAR
jgi:TonB-dependent SusC/RagA subfamily outer membrane receptor